MSARYELPESITIHQTRVGVLKYYGRCSEHPKWVPGSVDSKSLARERAIMHAEAKHDGINRDGMPADLVHALDLVREPRLRRELAAAARRWAEPEPETDRSLLADVGTWLMGEGIDFVHEAAGSASECIQIEWNGGDALTIRYRDHVPSAQVTTALGGGSYEFIGVKALHTFIKNFDAMCDRG